MAFTKVSLVKCVLNLICNDQFRVKNNTWINCSLWTLMIMTSYMWRQSCRLHLRPPSGLWNEASVKSVSLVVSNHTSQLGSVLNIKSGSDLHSGHCVSAADLLVWEGKLAMDRVITVALKQLPPSLQFKARYAKRPKKHSHLCVQHVSSRKAPYREKGEASKVTKL